MTRKEFIGAATAFAAFSPRLFAEGSANRYLELQAEIDQIKAAEYFDYMQSSLRVGELGSFFSKINRPALKRLDAVVDTIKSEIKKTRVTSGTPAVWLVYNMGLVIKTAETCFAIDLVHRRAAELAPLFDFLLLTHNHSDHCSEPLYKAVNGAKKTVISNFKDNYGVADWSKNGGYVRGVKTFGVRDVEIKTALSDHNGYLVDFTTTFEIRVGNFVIYHTGDSSNISKLNPTAQPDLWVVHPRCGLNVLDGYRKFAPKQTAICHLNELGHDKWRWSWADGLAEKAKIEGAGGKAFVPVWGERIV